MAIVQERLIGPVQRSALTSSFLGWMFDGFETSTMILVGPAAVTSLLGVSAPDAVRLGVGTALGATLIGWAVGGVIGSIMADYVGRKRMLMISIAGYCAFTALTAMSNTLAMLFALRFLTGLFLGSEWSTGTALVAETWPASARAKALGIMQSGYGFGFFLAAVLWLFIQPFGAEAWRWMFAIGVLPALALIYMRRGVGESKLWEEAVADSQNNNKGRPFTLAELLGDRNARRNALATLVMAAVTVSVFYAISALTGPFIGGIAASEGRSAASWASISASSTRSLARRSSSGSMSPPSMRLISASIWSRCAFSATKRVFASGSVSIASTGPTSAQRSATWRAMVVLPTPPLPPRQSTRTFAAAPRRSRWMSWISSGLYQAGTLICVVSVMRCLLADTCLLAATRAAPACGISRAHGAGPGRTVRGGGPESSTARSRTGLPGLLKRGIRSGPGRHGQGRGRGPADRPPTASRPFGRLSVGAGMRTADDGGSR